MARLAGVMLWVYLSNTASLCGLSRVYPYAVHLVQQLLYTLTLHIWYSVFAFYDTGVRWHRPWGTMARVVV